MNDEMISTYVNNIFDYRQQATHKSIDGIYYFPSTLTFGLGDIDRWAGFMLKTTKKQTVQLHLIPGKPNCMWLDMSRVIENNERIHTEYHFNGSKWVSEDDVGYLN